MTKNNNILIVSAIVGGALLIGALVYVFGFTPAKDIFTRGRADRALSRGRIEVARENDLKNYFVFLPAEEVSALLAASPEKFLFPQVEFLLASGKILTIGEQEMNIEGAPKSFVTISGLASGAKIYSTTDGFVRGGIVSNEDNAYAWMSEFWTEGRHGETILTYFAASPISAMRDLTFSVNVQEGIYAHVREHLQLASGSHLASLRADNTLPENLVPGGVNIAMAIERDGPYTAFGLENVLTQNGRIVMIQR